MSTRSNSLEKPLLIAKTSNQYEICCGHIFYHFILISVSFLPTSRDGATEKLVIAFYYDFFLRRCKHILFHIVKKGRFQNAWIQVEFTLNSPDFRWKSFLYDIHLLCERKKIFTLTLFRMGLFETAHG